jgi:hypothetical protein
LSVSGSELVGCRDERRPAGSFAAPRCERGGHGRGRHAEYCSLLIPRSGPVPNLPAEVTGVIRLTLIPSGEGGTRGRMVPGDYPRSPAASRASSSFRLATHLDNPSLAHRPYVGLAAAEQRRVRFRTKRDAGRHGGDDVLAPIHPSMSTRARSRAVPRRSRVRRPCQLRDRYLLAGPAYRRDCSARWRAIGPGGCRCFRRCVGSTRPPARYPLGMAEDAGDPGDGSPAPGGSSSRSSALASAYWAR